MQEVILSIIIFKVFHLGMSNLLDIVNNKNKNTNAYYDSSDINNYFTLEVL
jgi:hypothetical protein